MRQVEAISDRVLFDLTVRLDASRPKSMRDIVERARQPPRIFDLDMIAMAAVERSSDWRLNASRPLPTGGLR